MTTKDSKKATRELTIITRYEMKKDGAGYLKGDVVLVVENDKGARYTITLRRAARGHSCTCKASKRCYHINASVTLENARAAATVAQKRAAVSPARVEMPAQEKDISTAPLTNNRGFSLLKTA